MNLKIKEIVMNLKKIFIGFIPVKSIRKTLRKEIHQKECIDKWNRRVALSCDIGDYEGLLVKGTNFPHPVGIVISRYVKMGTNCVIYQNVTLGRGDFPYERDVSQEEYPQVGNNVIIYSGACVVGSVKIGDNAVIGANAVVLNDVPAGAVAAGVPAKIVRQY